MPHADDIKTFINGGLDGDTSPEWVAVNDYLSAYNVRLTGTSEGEYGNITNIESTEEIPNTLSDGINKCIGAAAFESIRKVIAFIYNSQQEHQIIEIDFDTNELTILFTNLTDSDGVNILPLDPQYYVTDIKLINDTYLAFTDSKTAPKFFNLVTLRSQVGEAVIYEEQDLLLIKKQNLPPITGEYGDDAGRVVNLLSGKLFQFISQFIGLDNTYSAWSTISKRFIPDSESTPSVGTDVTKNNVLILSVEIGDNRVKTLNIGARYSVFDFFTIKSVSRAYIITLPDEEVDIDNGIYEGYNPTTNIYSFAFYNDGLYTNIAPLETDLPYDYVALIAGALEVLNGNELILGDITEGYDRPETSVSLSATSYDPQINITIPPDADNFTVTDRITDIFHGDPLSGNFRNEIIVVFGGVPEAGDVVKILIANSTDANDTFPYSYPVQSGQDYNSVLDSVTSILPNSSRNSDSVRFYKLAGALKYYYLVYAKVDNATVGAGISKSIHALLDNSSYQLALAYRDAFGRYFPLVTGNEFIIKTASFAQSNGLTPLINWSINTLNAPEGAVDYQWVMSENNTAENVLDVVGGLLDYQSAWNADSNTPTLAPGTGTPLQAYQVSAPGTENLGNGETDYNTGDGVFYNGETWDKISKDFGDITTLSDYLFISLAPLKRFNDKNSSSVLAYEYSEGDRCTIHSYYDDPDTIWLDDPCIDVEVVAYDPATNLLKIRKSSNLDTTDIEGKDIYMRLYTPKRRTQTTDGITSNTETLFFEIGERFTITNGVHDTLSGTITDGDVYFKTREYTGAVDPTDLKVYLATDFNFSDFYISNYNSYGRPRTYTDTLERTERKASIRYSDLAILGSKVNGLTRFYGERIYGEGAGESSSNYGAIRKLVQRNNILVCIQDLKVGYIPVYNSIIESQDELQQLALSDKILNQIRYNTSGNIGMGNAKESFAMYNNNLYWVDPYRSEPVRAGLDGVFPISFKMSKYFKNTLQAAYQAGRKMIGWYDVFNNEYGISIEDASDVVVQFDFNATNWEYLEPYTIAPADVTGATDPPHGTISYNSGTGIATYTPDNNYVGTDSTTVSFTVDAVPKTKNGCITVTSGTTSVNQFIFIDLTNQALSTVLTSNTIGVQGNNIPVAISITGGTYSINGGSFTSIAGTVNEGDTVRVRQTSSASPSTLTTATLTISDKSDGFDVTTAP